MTAALELDELVALLHAGASARDEALSSLAHGLQCAWELSRSFPDDPELQVAGLVHDIGHQLAPGDDAGHGRVGGRAVRELLGARVGDLVELHVPAKRFLVTMDPGYGHILSTVSTTTLARQGGPMTATEAADFLAHPYAEHAVTLRLADDAAKVPGRAVPDLDHWRPVLAMVASTSGRQVGS